MTTKNHPNVSFPSPPAAAEVSAAAEAGATSKINTWFARHWLLTFNAAWGLFVILPWLAPIFMEIGWAGPGKAIYFIYNFFCHQLPERSWFLFGPQFSYAQPDIAGAWGVSMSEMGNELFRRRFIGTSELGWKVAWSDRMVSMYGSIFLFGIGYAMLRKMGQKIKGISWWVFLLLVLPMALDGSTHLLNDVLPIDFRQTNAWAAFITGHAFPAEFYVDDRWGSLNSLLRLITGLLFGLAVVGFLWPLMDREFSPQNN
jgi:uncharacterized membrane protein